MKFVVPEPPHFTYFMFNHCSRSYIVYKKLYTSTYTFIIFILQLYSKLAASEEI
jgi:hypothetical protein